MLLPITGCTNIHFLREYSNYRKKKLTTENMIFYALPRTNTSPLYRFFPIWLFTMPLSMLKFFRMSVGFEYSQNFEERLDRKERRLENISKSFSDKPMEFWKREPCTVEMEHTTYYSITPSLSHFSRMSATLERHLLL